MKPFTDEAINLIARRTGENDAILEVFSRMHGRIHAFVYGGASKRKRPLLEKGLKTSLEYRAKNEDALGYFDRIEPITNIADFLGNHAGLCAISSVCALMHETLPEKMAYPSLFDATEILINSIKDDENWPAVYVSWEVGLLSHCGFGLHLGECAMTGAKENLYWVSPRTGCAATYEAGLPFKDKLLKLPPFLTDTSAEIEIGDIADGFALTGFFIERDLLGQASRPMPEARAQLIYALGRASKL